MEAVLIGAGLVLAIWGLLRAKRGRAADPPEGRRRRGRAGAAPAGEAAAGIDPAHADDPRERAMMVLRQPISYDLEGWAGLTGASPAKQFRMGAVFGVGTGLVLAGVVMTLGAFWAGGGTAPADAAAGDRAAAADANPSYTDTTPLPDDNLSGTAAGLAATDPGELTGADPSSSDPDAQGGTPDPANATDPGTAGTPDSGSQPAGQEVRFVIKMGTSAYQIAYDLKAQGLIDNQGKFLDRLAERKLDTRLQAGTFRLRTGMTLDQVIDALVTAQ